MRAKEIGSDGGTITASDGLTVTIPAGAIDGGPITIEIKSTGTVSGNNYQANVIHFSTGFVGFQTNPSDGDTMNCIPGAGYCIDPTTGYWWQNPPFDGVKQWQEAVAYCPTLNIGGETGWHLPTISQRRSLIRG